MYISIGRLTLSSVNLEEDMTPGIKRRDGFLNEFPAERPMRFTETISKPNEKMMLK